jgi:hypothetical protein
MRRKRTICKKQHDWLRMLGLTLLAVVLYAMQAQADMITTIESDLTPDGMGQTINLELATNIWTAHEDTPYALTEADSLELSIEAVLRAIAVAGMDAGFIQSNIAIDDAAGIGISVGGDPCGDNCSINFGDVPVPESPALPLVLTGLNVLLIGAWLRRRNGKVQEIR